MEKGRVLDIVVFSICAIIFIFITMEIYEDLSTPQYTTFYETINVTEVKELINTSENITVVDIRGLEGCGTCQFKQGHLPGAIRSTDSSMFYNYTSDIVVYSVDGTLGETFCCELLNHTYGEIYNLQGGWNAWNS